MGFIDEGMLSISHFERSTALLGPYKRFVIWVYGCCFNCDGCLAHNTKYGVELKLSLRELVGQVSLDDVEGITISGGEPFLQAPVLYDFVSLLRSKKDIGIIIYSGYTKEELQKDERNLPLLSITDILIDGRYIKALDDGRAYVGSSNQKVHYLSERYKEIGPYYYAARKRKAEIKLTGNQAILIGVPSAETLNVWNDIKKRTGGVVYDF